MDVNAKKEHLSKLLKGMDVPSWRCTSYPWLAKNLAIRNAQHADFTEASRLIEEIIASGQSQ